MGASWGRGRRAAPAQSGGTPVRPSTARACAGLSVARVTVCAMEILIGALVGLLIGVVVTVLLARIVMVGRTAALSTERDLLRERVVDLEATVSEDAQTASVLAPLRDALGRVERQVSTLERDRVEQFAQLGERLSHVTTTTDALRAADRLAGRLAQRLHRPGHLGRGAAAPRRRARRHAGPRATSTSRSRRVSRTSAASAPTSWSACPATSTSWSTPRPR